MGGTGCGENWVLLWRQGLPSKSLIQFSAGVFWWCSVGVWPEGAQVWSLVGLMVTPPSWLIQQAAPPKTAAASAPDPSAGHCQPMPLLKWSEVALCNPMQPTRLLYPWDFPGKSTGVGCHAYRHVWLIMYAARKADEFFVNQSHSNLF